MILPSSDAHLKLIFENIDNFITLLIVIFSKSQK